MVQAAVRSSLLIQSVGEKSETNCNTRFLSIFGTDGVSLGTKRSHPSKNVRKAIFGVPSPGPLTPLYMGPMVHMASLEGKHTFDPSLVNNYRRMVLEGSFEVYSLTEYREIQNIKISVFWRSGPDFHIRAYLVKSPNLSIFWHILANNYRKILVEGSLDAYWLTAYMEN